MDENFRRYLVSRGIGVERYQAASIGEQGQILSVYEQQQARGNVLSLKICGCVVISSN